MKKMALVVVSVALQVIWIEREKNQPTWMFQHAKELNESEKNKKLVKC